MAVAWAPEISRSRQSWYQGREGGGGGGGGGFKGEVEFRCTRLTGSENIVPWRP
jgi:hypothetical protein